MLLIKLIIIFAAFCFLLYALSSAISDFQISNGAIPIVALILVGVNYAVTWIFTALNFITLGIVKWLLMVLTLGLFYLLAGFILNVIIFWIADRFTDKLTIKSKKALFISAFALQITTYIIDKIF
ncbi:MAG TPA: phage holin family protein [Turneriella sp.]|nr:phage holin family protein [Turneriella sp.]